MTRPAGRGSSIMQVHLSRDEVDEYNAADGLLFRGKLVRELTKAAYAKGRRFVALYTEQNTQLAYWEVMRP